MSYLADGPEIPQLTPTGVPQHPIPHYRGFPQLFLERDSLNHLLYRIDDQLYDAVNLNLNAVPEDEMILVYLLEIHPEMFTSIPLFVKTDQSEHIFMTMQGQLYEVTDDEIIKIHDSSDLPPATIQSVVPFKIPFANASEFDRTLYERFVRLLNNHLRLNELDFPEIFSFEQAVRMFQTGQVYMYTIDPTEGILKLTLVDGTSALTKVLYDEGLNKIYSLEHS